MKKLNSQAKAAVESYINEWITTANPKLVFADKNPDEVRSPVAIIHDDKRYVKLSLDYCGRNITSLTIKELGKHSFGLFRYDKLKLNLHMADGDLFKFVVSNKKDESLQDIHQKLSSLFKEPEKKKVPKERPPNQIEI